VSPWDEVGSQTIQGKELGSLRCIARVKQAEWKSVREGQDAAELPSISQSLFETRPLRFGKVVYDVRHEIIPHVEQRPALGHSQVEEVAGPHRLREAVLNINGGGALVDGLGIGVGSLELK